MRSECEKWPKKQHASSYFARILRRLPECCLKEHVCVYPPVLVDLLQAGDASVKVEYRGAAEERYGRGLERTMKFGDFVGELERKNDLLYLTTQVRKT